MAGTSLPASVVATTGAQSLTQAELMAHLIRLAARPPALTLVDADSELPTLLHCPVGWIAVRIRFELWDGDRRLRGWHRITPLFKPNAEFEIALGESKRRGLLGLLPQIEWRLDDPHISKQVSETVEREAQEIARRYGNLENFVRYVDLDENDADDAPELWSAIAVANHLIDVQGHWESNDEDKSPVSTPSDPVLESARSARNAAFVDSPWLATCKT